MAILGIPLFHVGHLRGGWLGVDIFFVLSGFLITNATSPLEHCWSLTVEAQFFLFFHLRFPRAWFSLDGDGPRVYHGLLFPLAIAATMTIGSAILVPRGLVAECFEIRPDAS